MDNKIIDGKKLAQKHEELFKEKIEKLSVKPRLAAILIGNDPASVLYVNLKEKKAKELGIDFEKYLIPARTNFSDLVILVKSLNGPEGPDGIMVQLPIPEEFLQDHKSEEILQLIDPKKDVDGLTGNSQFLPAVVGAILSILKDEKVEVGGNKVAVLGRSNLVGKPVAKELVKMGAEVLVGHSETPNLKEITENADIIISAVGKPNLVTGEMIKNGVVIIDAGTSKYNGSIVGDVDFESVYPKASKITPVPGGVGPMTVITLMENLVEAMTRK